MPRFLRKSPSSTPHRRQNFCCILSLPLLLSKKASDQARQSGPQLSVALTAPRPQTHQRESRCVVNRPPTLLSEDLGCTLKGGVKVCQRQLVKEMFGLLVTECTLDSAYQGATPNQRALQGGLLVRI